MVCKFFAKNLEAKILASKKDAVASIPELAVVLIILGLLVTSFATFSKIIGVAKANSIISAMNTIKEASYSFKNSYQFLPGDIINAASVIDSTQKNGNGDGLISWGQPTTNSTPNESLSFYQHLKAIGAISGINDVDVVAATEASVTAGTIFRSNIDGAGFLPVSFKPNNGVLPEYGFDNTTKPGSSYTIIFANVGTDNTKLAAASVAGPVSVVPSVANSFSTGAVDVAVAYSIDKKIDDTVATTGKLRYNAAEVMPIVGYNVEL